MHELIDELLRGLDSVFGVLALFVAVTGFAVSGTFVEDRNDRATLDAMLICGAIAHYREQHQAEPTELRAPFDADDLAKLPRDPWGNDYALETSSRGPAIWSYGSDGAPGGTGSAADLRYECTSGLQMRSTE